VSSPLLSTSWYRVAGLRPRLRSQTRLHRHVYRDAVWYLLQDPASARVHRFTPAARVVIAAMDGRRTVEELWTIAQERMGDDAPTQDDMTLVVARVV